METANSGKERDYIGLLIVMGWIQQTQVLHPEIMPGVPNAKVIRSPPP